jgi:prepilin-type N-terminal cleavage/methylation domain-containing protein
MRRAVGLTLIELLVVLAITGLLLGIGAFALTSLHGKTRAQGYLHALGEAIQQATSQANAQNQLYALILSPQGFSWGPISSSSISACEASQPTLSSVVSSDPLPPGLSQTTGWLCISPPGLIHHLSSLSSTCTYQGYSVTCIQLSGTNFQASILVSDTGGVLLQ